MNSDTAKTTFIVLLAAITIFSWPAIFLFGRDCGCQLVERKAIEAGAAYYEVDQKTGVVHVVFMRSGRR